jgi:hypothetical protein
MDARAMSLIDQKMTQAFQDQGNDVRAARG